MKVRLALVSAVKKAIFEALATDMLTRLAHEVFPDYDLRARTGLPATLPIPPQMAVDRIVDDALAADRFLMLIEHLALLDHEGFRGRAYRVQGLREIVRGICAEGYVWDEDTARFMEDSRIRKTRNWGRLLEGEESRFALLRIDIVKSSLMVQEHGEAAARAAYDDLRSIFSRCVEIRSGRVWGLEGDGALAAFHFGHPTTRAVLAGMALLHELFLYNRIGNLLGQDLVVRAAVHTGPLRYSDSIAEIARQETVREIREVESKLTPAGSLAITPAVDPTLDRVIRDRFRPGSGESARLQFYEVRVGAA